MVSKRTREGELLVDHRASPGLPVDFWQHVGLPGYNAPPGAVAEMPTMTCAHCNTIVVLNPARTRVRGYCRKCDAYVCDNPACNAHCTPFNAVLDRLEQRAYRRDQITLLNAHGLPMSKGT